MNRVPVHKTLLSALVAAATLIMGSLPGAASASASSTLSAVQDAASASGAAEAEKPVYDCADMETYDCTNLGSAYQNGYEGKEIDLDRARQLYMSACYDRDEKRACGLLGTIYRDGLGVEKDTNRAVEFYDLSCAMGDGVACNLGCRLEVSQLCRQAGNFYKRVNGKENWVFEFYTKGCLLGDANQCWLAGSLWKPSYRTETPEYFYKKGCELGHAESCAKLATEEASEQDE